MSLPHFRGDGLARVVLARMIVAYHGDDADAGLHQDKRLVHGIWLVFGQFGDEESVRWTKP